MKQTSFKQVIGYSGIVMFWVVLLGAGLYAPDVVRALYSTREFRILTWGDIFDPAYIRLFEQQHGVSVRMSYYASNEELIVKLHKTGGAEYDLIVPSDYAVTVLRSQGLLKKLDHEKMPFVSRLNPRLLGHAYDPNNEYSLPFEWELYGIGYDSRFFADTNFVPDWGLVFHNPRGAYKVVMTNDPVEAVMCAARFLYPHVEKFSPEQIAELRSLLRRQNRWVEAYSSIRAGYYLATGSSPVAITTTTYVAHAHKYAPYIAFALPESGGFLTIENFAIPLHGAHDDLAYAFMDFMYRPAAALHHFEAYANLPAVLDDAVVAALPAATRDYILMDMADFKQLRFFKRLLSEQQMTDVWVAVKS